MVLRAPLSSLWLYAAAGRCVACLAGSSFRLKYFLRRSPQRGPQPLLLFLHGVGACMDAAWDGSNGEIVLEYQIRFLHTHPWLPMHVVVPHSPSARTPGRFSGPVARREFEGLRV